MPEDSSITPPDGVPPSTARGEPTREERFLAAIAHVCIVAILPSVTAPLLIWLTERNKLNRSDLVLHNAKQAIVFQLLIVCLVLLLALTFLRPAAMILGVAAGVYGIVAGIAAYAGHRFEYLWIGSFAREL